MARNLLLMKWMKIEQLLESDPPRRYWLRYTVEKGFFVTLKGCRDKNSNRQTLARFYDSCVEKCGSNTQVRQIWTNSLRQKLKKSLPKIVQQDGFLRYHSLGLPLRLSSVIRIWNELSNASKSTSLNPIHIFWNPQSSKLYNVVGAPPGFLSKFIRKVRFRKDETLLARIESDLRFVAEIEDHEFRKILTLAVLSFAAIYRELEGKQLAIPSFTKSHHLICYHCKQHLIEQGVKTVSMVPPESEAEACGLYLCQGTEIWPSQRSALGSIAANFATHGSATQAYAHSWRRIHKHLKDLTEKGKRPLPLIAGHSMGGSLIIQTALYAHGLVQEAHAFNPPMPNERDFSFYNKLPKKTQKKVNVHANLDDFAFWRIGSKVIGQITLYFGKVRRRYYPITLLDTILILPAIFKLTLNLKHAFPAHQLIFSFDEHSLRVRLNQEEIRIENQKRGKRFDYLSFFPKLYDPMQIFLKMIRNLFGWSLKGEYLRNELEIVMLHEQDLASAITPENEKQMKKELAELGRQREQLLKKISRLKK
ncbi:MAG: hypothetical protein S4CHLAM45_15160 [Chlamydiales bacterium]|nr:hypothetical protein [Chlamydiales bacterium]MCH9620133.1 hypothetical protein [Chlamydiales bacterium]MCH9623603.1 hypothetical protein [Chlamydiales bacterium]